MKETDLYLPIKKYLEEKGFMVKSEIHGCDVVAQREDNIVIVELKKSFNLDLVLQGLDRKTMTDFVYLAIPRPKSTKGNRWRGIKKLCKMLSIGLIFVAVKGEESLVEVVEEPKKYIPNYNLRKTKKLQKEFDSRKTDFNLGGSSKRPILTAYKEDALLIALNIRDKGESLPIKEIKELTQNDRAGIILRSNVYKWFERVERGIYKLSDKGLDAIEQYSYALPYLLSDIKGNRSDINEKAF